MHPLSAEDKAGQSPMAEERAALVRRGYEAFNRRDIDTVLSLLDPGVSWPNVLDRTVIHGHPAVREYWEHQFRLIDSRVEPTAFAWRGETLIVSVRQVIEEHETGQVRENQVAHAYTFRGTRILGMRVYPTVEEALTGAR